MSSLHDRRQMEWSSGRKKGRKPPSLSPCPPHPTPAAQAINVEILALRRHMSLV